MPLGVLLRRLLAVGLIAGALSGLALGVLQLLFTSPLIHQAEAFEPAEPHQPGTDEAWQPAEGTERALYTVLMSVIAGIGFGLLLNAAMLLRRHVGLKLGAGWGLAAFAVVALAPALGLPPELPGVPAANLEARQLWWWLTVISTAAGVACLAFTRVLWPKLLAILLLSLPHVIGAPSKHVLGTSPVEHLEKPFIAASLAVALVFWLLLGALSGWGQQRLGLHRAALEVPPR